MTILRMTKVIGTSMKLFDVVHTSFKTPRQDRISCVEEFVGEELHASQWLDNALALARHGDIITITVKEY